MVSVQLAILFAILSPCIFAFMNTLDKFAISKKVKYPLGFTVMAGLATLIWGFFIAIFLDWKNIELMQIWPAALSGFIIGTQYYLYYKILEKEDVSNMSGLVYLYPILIAIFSYFFLGEILSPIAYLGVALTIIGVLILSIRVKKLSGMSVLYMIGLLIVIVAAYEFLIKVSVTNLSEMHGISVEFIFIGLAISLGLFSKKVRKLAYKEFKNFKWAMLSETLTLLAIGTTFFAMSSLSATIVSSIATIQPLVILFFERSMSGIFGKIHKDKITLSRIIAMTLIIIGVLILTLNGI